MTNAYRRILIDNSGVPKEERAKEGVVIMIQSKYRNQIRDCRHITQKILMIKMRVQRGTIKITRI